ncbi:MAG: hypothetical protein JKY94_17350 [Rhodobacteraceae bacterium]|nr:hypothetical protein [Paracoccaceae bacterium]
MNDQERLLVLFLKMGYFAAPRQAYSLYHQDKTKILKAGFSLAEFQALARRAVYDRTKLLREARQLAALPPKEGRS